MESSLGSELVHLPCGRCHQVSSFSLQSLETNDRPSCPYCGFVMKADLGAAERDAAREAHELDMDVDSLGSGE